MTNTSNGHTFHIPVMGTGFTIDTPLKVAKFGISSVISLVDDVLIEQMRKFHAERSGEPYETVTDQDEDSRAHRITLYLNLVFRLVQRQIQDLKASPFSPDSDIVRYYELLPDVAPKRLYKEMLLEDDSIKKLRMQERLRSLVMPGSIDVNIMTKLDKDNYKGRQKLAPEYADALSALRGYALSDLHSSIIFSAGMNPRLFTYITQFEDFFPNKSCELKKKIVLKVSDFRSAEIQGKFLAKRGIWVSEYRIESGLNCGGHSFPTVGFLLGPVLEEFKLRKTELIEKLFTVCNKALAAEGRIVMDDHPTVKITVQGGIGTFDEDKLLREYYNVDGTGWGTPFLLVPEATNVDTVHLNKLAEATEQEVYLSKSTPLGVPFWNLRNSDSELERQRRIRDGCPGSPCPKRFGASNTEFTKEPICPASRDYQRRKLKRLTEEGYTQEQLSVVRAEMLSKSCICHDLGGSVKIKNDIESDAFPALCPGPNIVNFSRIATLEEMVNHIYGRFDQMMHPDRPHMFIQELSLYINYLRDEIERFSIGLSTRKQKYFNDFKHNLCDGIEYYRQLPETIIKDKWNLFLKDLKTLYDDVEGLTLDSTAVS